MMKPEKETQLGSVTYMTTYLESSLVYARDVLQRRYDHSRITYEHDRGDHWCKYHEPEWIERIPDPSDPLCFRGTLGIKWKVTGRAYYLKRHFRAPKEDVRRHPNKRHVPRKKRGRPILRGKKSTLAGFRNWRCDN